MTLKVSDYTCWVQALYGRQPFESYVVARWVPEAPELQVQERARFEHEWRVAVVVDQVRKIGRAF